MPTPEKSRRAFFRDLVALGERGVRPALDPVHPGTGAPVELRAHIREERCLGSGCLLCVEPCPEGAIVLGRAHTPHVRSDVCSGCGVCADVCPVDPNAIEMRPAPRGAGTPMNPAIDAGGE